MIKTKELNLYLELLIQFLKITNALSIEYTNTLLPFSFFKPQKQLINQKGERERERETVKGNQRTSSCEN